MGRTSLSQPAAEDAEARGADDGSAPADAPSPTRALPLDPTIKMTAHQFFYIFVLDGIGAMILSGGINFAIAYAMYSTQDTTRHPIRLFQLPNTLAGDAAVTIIIQTFITWLAEYILVNRDLHRRAVAPAAFIRRPRSRFGRWWFLLQPKTITTITSRNGSSGDASNSVPTPAPVPATSDVVDSGTPPAAGGSDEHYLIAQAVRALAVSIAAFVLLWGPSVGILTTLGARSGGDWVFKRIWVPQLFKLVFGGVLALLTTPAFAVFWLARAGWMAVAESDGEGEGEGGEEAGGSGAGVSGPA